MNWKHRIWTCLQIAGLAVVWLGSGAGCGGRKPSSRSRDVSEPTTVTKTLSLRIAPESSNSNARSPLSSADVQRYESALAAAGPEASRDNAAEYAWFTVRGDVSTSKLIYSTWNSKRYVLLSNKSGEILAEIKPDSVKPESDCEGTPAVLFSLNDADARQLQDLTARNRGRALAIVVDDVAYSIPVIMATVSNQVMITGNFTREEVRQLCLALDSNRK